MNRFFWIIGCLICCLEATPIFAQSKSKESKGQLGLNLTSVVDYSTELVFLDAFKQSRPWLSQAPGVAWDKAGPIQLDDQGWPKKLNGNGHFVETLMFVDIGNHYPKGTYTCLYDGKGEITFSTAGKVKSATPGKILVDVDPNKGQVALQLRQTDSTNPVRNIRFLMPGFEKTYDKEPFHPALLKRIEGYQVLRFMDWGHTNNSKISTWEDRAKPDYAFQTTEKGVALEYQIELANRTNCDAWFCIPHKANEEYVREFARLVKAKLKPELKVYIEYSNETWNSQFEQARYCQEQGKKLKFSNNDFEAQLRYSAHRSVEIFKIVEKEFGSKDRLVRVIAAQSANPWTGTTEMDWKQAYKSADAIAIAPYFGNAFGDPKTADQVANMSVDQLLDGCSKALDENKKILEKYAAEAKKRGLQLITYESGQHLAGYGGAENNERLTKLFHAANRDPRMKELYLKDLKNWNDIGGGLYTVFASMGKYSKWGSWGVLEYHDQDESTAPKLAAIREYMQKSK